jgi:hypothetical protein
MRKELPTKLEDGRVTYGPLASRKSDGAYGGFFVQGPCGARLKIIASGGDPDDIESQGWEHVSVSTERRPPNWQEMCFVKDLFWSEDECAIQYHPPKSEYVNNHPYCLHLWSRRDGTIPMPPSILVGVKSRGVLSEAEAKYLRQQMGL